MEAVRILRMFLHGDGLSAVTIEMSRVMCGRDARTPVRLCSVRAYCFFPEACKHCSYFTLIPVTPSSAVIFPSSLAFVLSLYPSCFYFFRFLHKTYFFLSWSDAVISWFPSSRTDWMPLYSLLKIDNNFICVLSFDQRIMLAIGRRNLTWIVFTNSARTAQ
jgi:hypothetical protein